MVLTSLFLCASRAAAKLLVNNRRNAPSPRPFASCKLLGTEEKMMKRIALLVAVSALAAGCSNNAPPPVAPAPVVPAVDATSPLYGPMFLQMAASANMWEIQSSQLALQRSQNVALRNAAQMIISDHTMLGSQMMAAATAAGLAPPPPGMMPQEQQMLSQLQATPAGPAFDMAYRDMQIAAHQQAIQLFQNYANSGDNPTLRAAAAQALPKLQMHLATMQALVVAAPVEPAPRPGERG
jgi:putative membrane protein